MAKVKVQDLLGQDGRIAIARAIGRAGAQYMLLNSTVKVHVLEEGKYAEATVEGGGPKGTRPTYYVRVAKAKRNGLLKQRTSFYARCSCPRFDDMGLCKHSLLVGQSAKIIELGALKKLLPVALVRESNRFFAAEWARICEDHGWAKDAPSVSTEGVEVAKGKRLPRLPLEPELLIRKRCEIEKAKRLQQIEAVAARRTEWIETVARMMKTNPELQTEVASIMSLMDDNGVMQKVEGEVNESTGEVMTA